ncbi:hypothetical protein CUV01_12385 [Paracoccus tegillarcae]|uniref:NrtR DNA-binding winged helix domain-containing protein n=2 Tax=Paracoccus tegillarcae TaxID=1529068 RepID=A0A2K9EQX7_9RHOB|nr:hypothetical protein CUV01_12385 [Paracoccus tegillarcae]
MPTGFNQAELIAVLVAVTAGSPRVMTIELGGSLPSGNLESGHHSLQAGLRAWVEDQTHHPVGYLEQLYTFADHGRGPDAAPGARRISISYLGLVHEQSSAGTARAEWQDWYDYFPWEDYRDGRAGMLDQIVTRLNDWAATAPALCDERLRRVQYAFGTNGAEWNEDLVLQRYELMYEAGLVAESGQPQGFGRPMMADHRRILATGIARLRAKIKYQPVMFELMPDSFTLLHLQQTVEAIAGLRLHKSNFRRQIDQHALIEETGEMSQESRGRPAKLFRYRREVVEARALAGSRLPISRD